MAGTSDTPSDGLQPEPASHSPQPQQSQPPFTYPAREAGVAVPEHLNRSGWLSILEQDESDTARTYQPAHRQEYGGLHYDPDFILAPGTDPRALSSSESWLSHSQRHTQRVLAHPLPISLADMSGSSKPKNIGNIPTDWIPPPSQGPGEARDGVPTRQDEHSQLAQISTPAPMTTIDQLGDTALSAVSRSSNLPSHSSDSISWISFPDLPLFSRKVEGWAITESFAHHWSVRLFVTPLSCGNLTRTPCCIAVIEARSTPAMTTSRLWKLSTWPARWVVQDAVMTMQSWNVSSGRSSTNGRSSKPSTTSPTQGSACFSTSKPSTTQREFIRLSDTEHPTNSKNTTKQN